MRTLGLLGGMAWDSTLTYYRLINQRVRERLGGLRSAPIILYSVDFEPIERMQRESRWAEAGQYLGTLGRKLKNAGAQMLLICTNTMHRVADEVERLSGVPLLHIADATAQVLKTQGIRTVGLLGTRYVMEQDFYVGRLRERHGLEVVVPDEAGRQTVHQIIFQELVQGIRKSESRQRLAALAEGLIQRGAQAVILGCTELGLLLHPGDIPVPLFDTTVLHAQAAADWAMADELPPPHDPN